MGAADILHLYTGAMTKDLKVEQLKIHSSKKIKLSPVNQFDLTYTASHSPSPTQKMTNPAMLSTTIAWQLRSFLTEAIPHCHEAL